jgi:spore coat protein U-like protein
MRTFVLFLVFVANTRLWAASPNQPVSVGIQINVGHTVTLTWKAPANPSTFQLGYNLYRDDKLRSNNRFRHKDSLAD